MEDKNTILKDITINILGLLIYVLFFITLFIVITWGMQGNLEFWGIFILSMIAYDAFDKLLYFLFKLLEDIKKYKK